ncbi:MAG: HAD hydrolase-like protein, partial [Cypionkella sp.]|nr:HAD hydrolase-like protein [Cypionkella sp.]
YCPHHPDGSVVQFAVECDCRKPAAGLILRAAEELSIDLAESWMVGDTLDEVLTLSDAIIVMKDGRVSARIEGVQATPPSEEELVKAMV